MEESPYDQKDQEGPCEQAREMLADYVFPKMLPYEVIRREQKGSENHQAEHSEDPVHPLFA